MNAPTIQPRPEDREALESLRLNEEERIVVDLLVGNRKLASILTLFSDRLNQRWERAKKYPEFSYVTDDNEMKDTVGSIPRETASFLNHIMRVAHQFSISPDRLQTPMEEANRRFELQTQPE